jgi:hypothetical protein
MDSRVEYLYIRHAEVGLVFGDAYGSGSVRHCQFLSVSNGIQNYDSGTIPVENTLFGHVAGYVLGADNYPFSIVFDAAQLTVDDAAYLTSANTTLNITNSILSNIASLAVGDPSGSDINGAYNGFYGTTAFGSQQFSPNTYPFFQSAAGGGYYLKTAPGGTDASGFRGVGTTTAVDPTLLADLKGKTTYPPQFYDSATISSDNFTQQVPRDSENPGPDLGYHYDPLDYVFENCLVNNSMTFPAGTAVGWQAGGLSFSGSSGKVNFNGTVDNPCYFVRCNTVQEQDQSGDGTGISASASTGFVYAYFTRFSAVGDVAAFLNGTLLDIRAANNCEFWNGVLGGNNNDTLVQMLGANCLF